MDSKRIVTKLISSLLDCLVMMILLNSTVSQINVLPEKILKTLVCIYIFFGLEILRRTEVHYSSDETGGNVNEWFCLNWKNFECLLCSQWHKIIDIVYIQTDKRTVTTRRIKFFSLNHRKYSRKQMIIILRKKRFLMN